MHLALRRWGMGALGLFALGGLGWVLTPGPLPPPAPAQAITPAPFDPAVALEPAAKLAAGLPRLRSLLVSWHGEIVLEQYFRGTRAATFANIKSASKSVISALIGIAIERGLLPGVAAPIAPFFPYLAGKTVDAEKRAITIEDLLTMRSGLRPTSGPYYGSWVVSPNWVQHVLSRPLVSPPGEAMHYSTGNTHLLSAILTKVSGNDTWSFAQQSLGKPLGITLAQWPKDPQGVYFGGNDMLMSPRQMAKFGELYLRHGRAGSQQVIPESWIDTSCLPRTVSPRSGQMYGYGWWVGELAGLRACYAWGFGGQYIFVVPDRDLVVVTTSSPEVGEDRRDHRTALYALVEDLVIRPFAEALGL
jgi:CubicO group peptidase (beta-lactamase class C family)